MKINEDIVPSTVEAAVDQVIAGLTAEDISEIKKSEPCSVHFTVGMFFA